LDQASLFLSGNPLIPAFSPKGEKESEAHVAPECAARSGSLPGWGEGTSRALSLLLAIAARL